MLERCRGAEGDKGELARQDCLAGMQAFEAEDVDGAVECVDRFRTNAGSKKAWDETELAAVREALRTVKAAIKDAAKEGRVSLAWGPADDAWAEMLPWVREAYRKVRSHLDAAKTRARALDFADLEVHALRALEHADVRKHYAERWNAYLVDEFQDTNPVQARILDLLLGRGDVMGRGAVPGRAATDPLVTVVGDEKQAIYGFRGADVGVFRRYRERIREDGGDEVVLEQSFRSHGALMARLNQVFGAVLGDLHQDLRAEREPAGDGPHLRFVPIEKVKGPNRAQRVVAEAHAIAAGIRDLIERGTQVYDKATGAHRPLEYGDIAVLARTWKPFDTYAEVLPALGVPAVHSGGGSLLDTREAKDGIALVRFLADPKDDIALVALLRSPFFGLDDRTLHDVAQVKDKDTSWWEALQAQVSAGDEHELPGRTGRPSSAARQMLERPVDILGSLLGQKRDLAPGRLVQLADEATGYSAVLANLPGARRRVADWRGFAALLRDLEHGSKDVFAVARRLRRLVQNEVEVPRPILHADDAVTLMTVHRAKGLEWPVVIVADLAGNGGNNTPQVLLEPDVGVAVKLEDDDGEALEPCLYTILKVRRKEREEAEEGRILYVALTRARDRVVLSADKPDGGQLKRLGDGLEAAAVAAEVVPFDAASTIIPDPPVPEVGDEQLLYEGRALWTDVSVGSGGLQADPGDPSVAAAVWSEALEVTQAFDAGWLPFLEALRDAGVPAPDPDRMFIELQRDGANTAEIAIAVWPSGERELAIVASGTAQGTYDTDLHIADPRDIDPASMQPLIDRLTAARAS
ncbi:MAG: 3'-5' exonuclease [Acidobacteriota bacterium]